MLVLFPPIFVADTEIIYGYNFVVPLIQSPIKKIQNTPVDQISGIKCCKQITKI